MKYHFSLPWNQTTAMGFIGEACFSTIVGVIFMLFNGMLLLLYVSMCLQHKAFYERFRHSLEKLDRPDKNRNNQEFLCELIQFLNTVRK